MPMTEPVDHGPEDSKVRQAPLVEVCVDLAPELKVRMDRCVGDVPMLEILTGQARLIVSVDVGDVRQLGARHVAVAEELAHAAAALRDELRELVR
jgi:hypothetical protein